MATYAKEKGFTVQTLSTDPVASQVAGGSWASGTAINNGRFAIGAAMAAPYTAALIFGGAPPVTASTEEWEAPDFEIKTVTTS